MSPELLMGIIGVVLSVPGVIFIFWHDAAAVLPLTIVAMSSTAVASVAGVVSWLSLKRKPLFMMDRVDTVLEFKTADASRATLTKDYKFRTTGHHHTEMEHRNIGADGVIEKIQWNREEIPADRKRLDCGEYFVTVLFSPPLERGKVYEGQLAYDAVDSFKSNDESVTYVVDFPAKYVKITVRFHHEQSRQPHDFYACHRVGGDKRALPQPKWDPIRREAVLRAKKPPVGSELVLGWHW